MPLNDSGIVLPPGFESAHSMNRLLEVLAEEFPQYHSDHTMQAQAGLAIGTLLGSVGAWVMFRSPNPEQSLDKFAKMVLTAGMDMAGKGHETIKQRVKTHGFGDLPFDPEAKG